MIILANGVFDPCHVGHLRHFESIKGRDDILWVSVTRDSCINKPGHPYFSETDRLKFVRGLRIVNGAFLCDSSIQALRKVIPDVFVKGSDYKGRISAEDKAFCKKYGIKIVITSTKKYSSTQLLKHYELRGRRKLQSTSSG